MREDGKLKGKHSDEFSIRDTKASKRLWERKSWRAILAAGWMESWAEEVLLVEKDTEAKSRTLGINMAQGRCRVPELWFAQEAGS